MFKGQTCSPSPGELTAPSCPHWTLCSSPTGLLCALDVHDMLFPTSASFLPSSCNHASLSSPTSTSTAHMLPPPGSLPGMRVLTQLSHITQHSQTLVRIIPVHAPQEGRDSSYTPSHLREHPAQSWACHTCSTGISGRNDHSIVIMNGWHRQSPHLSEPLGSASEHTRLHSSPD